MSIVSQNQREQQRLLRQRQCGWRSQRIVMAASLGAMLHAGIAYGTTFTWTGASNNNWSIAANWASSDPSILVPPATPATGDTTDLIWAGNLAANVTSTQNTGPIDVNSMTFNYTASGTATLSISGSSTGTQQINLGPGGITSTGTGTVAFASAANRTLVLTANQTWTHNDTSAIFAMRRAVSGNFQITKEGPGTVSFEASGATWTGGLVLNNGVIRLANASDAIGTGPITVNTSNGVGISASGSTETKQNVAGQVSLGGTGTFSFQGSWQINLQNTVTLENDKTISAGNLNAAATGLIAHVISGNIVGPGGLSKAGGGTLYFDGAANTYAGNTTVLNGVLSVGSFGQLGGGTMVTLGSTAPGAGTTTINSGTLNIRSVGDVTGRAIVLNAGGGNLNYAGGLTINNSITGVGGLTKVGTGNLNTGQINIGGALSATTGRTTIASNSGVNRINGAPVLGGGTGAWTSTLDLNDNHLIVDYDAAAPSALPAVQDQIKSGYAGGLWIGTGMTSSAAAAAAISAHKTALGYGEASDVLGPTGGTFAGQPVDGSTVLVRYTYSGDANLDGKVDTLDFNSLAANFGGSGKVWTQADFNFDGVVDTLDFNSLAANFGQQQASDGGGGVGALVPEPGAGIVVMMSGIGMAALRSRRRSRESVLS
jgi:autotransporter-associated beta strand protein